MRSWSCEACEFDDHYQHLSPAYAIILNGDNDHLDYFGNMDNAIASFHRFAGRAKKAVIYDADDANTRKLLRALAAGPSPSASTQELTTIR